MEKQPDDEVESGRVQHMRLVLGGRVEIERDIVRLCAQLHFDHARFDDLMRRLEGPPNLGLAIVARGALLPRVLSDD